MARLVSDVRGEEEVGEATFLLKLVRFRRYNRVEGGPFNTAETRGCAEATHGSAHAQPRIAKGVPRGSHTLLTGTNSP